MNNPLNPDMPLQELLLLMGELTKDEILLVRSVIRLANDCYEAPELSVFDYGSQKIKEEIENNCLQSLQSLLLLIY